MYFLFLDAAEGNIARKHVIEKETLLDKSEYAMLGIDDVQAEVIHTRALNRIMRNRRYGR